MLESQATAREIRRRLWNPSNGRVSSEVEIVSDNELRRRQRAKADEILQARRAQQDYERAMAAEDLLRKALEEHGHVMAIAQMLAEDEAPPPPPTIAEIITAVSVYYGFSTVEIRSDRRSAQVAFVRHVVMYLARTLTLRSLPEIGRRLGGRDHTTVLYGVRKVAALIDAEPRLSADIDNIKWDMGLR